MIEIKIKEDDESEINSSARCTWTYILEGGGTVCSVVPIVFLGDYWDPYDFDVFWYSMTKDIVIQNFREIINLKKTYPDKVTLLLGNHDCEYMYGLSVCGHRCDKENYDLIRSLFRENMDCGSILLMSKGGNVYDLSGKRFNCKESPFLPEPYPYAKDIKLDLDVFARPFCRVCGSRRIYIKAGSDIAENVGRTRLSKVFVWKINTYAKVNYKRL